MKALLITAILISQTCGQSRRSLLKTTSGNKASSADVPSMILDGESFGYGLPALFEIIHAAGALLPGDATAREWLCSSLRRISAPDIFKHLEEQDIAVASVILSELSGGNSSSQYSQGNNGPRAQPPSYRAGEYDVRDAKKVMNLARSLAEPPEPEYVESGDSKPASGGGGISMPGGISLPGMGGGGADMEPTPPSSGGFNMPGGNQMGGGGSSADDMSTGGGGISMPGGFSMPGGRKKRNTNSQGKSPADETADLEGRIEELRVMDKVSDTYKDLMQKRLFYSFIKGYCKF